MSEPEAIVQNRAGVDVRRTDERTRTTVSGMNGLHAAS